MDLNFEWSHIRTLTKHYVYALHISQTLTSYQDSLDQASLEREDLAPRIASCQGRINERNRFISKIRKYEDSEDQHGIERLATYMNRLAEVGDPVAEMTNLMAENQRVLDRIALYTEKLDGRSPAAAIDRLNTTKNNVEIKLLEFQSPRWITVVDHHDMVALSLMKELALADRVLRFSVGKSVTQGTMIPLRPMARDLGINSFVCTDLYELRGRDVRVLTREETAAIGYTVKELDV